MLKTSIAFFINMLLFCSFVVMVMEGIQCFGWRITPAQRKFLYDWSNAALIVAAFTLMMLVLLISVSLFIYLLE